MKYMTIILLILKTELLNCINYPSIIAGSVVPVISSQDYHYDSNETETSETAVTTETSSDNETKTSEQTTAITMTTEIECYDCVSQEWHIDSSCEVPASNTPVNKSCDKCYSIYPKHAGNEIIVRKCMTDEEFADSEYINKDKYSIHHCNTQLCNNKRLDMNQLDKLQEMEDKPDEITIDNLDKKCYRCSSVKNHDCKTISSTSETSNDCKNRLCVTLYDSENEVSMRDCYTWKRLQNSMHTKSYTLIYEWCNKELCNNKDMTDYPGCKENTVIPSEIGCYITSGIEEKTTTQHLTTEAFTTTTTIPTNTTTTIPTTITEQPTTTVTIINTTSFTIKTTTSTPITEITTKKIVTTTFPTIIFGICGENNVVMGVSNRSHSYLILLLICFFSIICL